MPTNDAQSCVCKASRFKPGEVGRRAMDALPGTIFAALVFPGLAEAGFPGLAAAGVIFLAVRKTGSVFLAMMLGMAAVAVLRLLSGN